MFQSLGGGTLLALTAAIGACGTTRSEVEKNNPVSKGAAMHSSEDMSAPPGGKAINKQFAGLDDYLAWLRTTQAPVDGPWYEEIRPGVYQLRTGNLRILGADGDVTPRDQIYSRAQLMKQFGFKK